jgi:hypothetical protein
LLKLFKENQKKDQYANELIIQNNKIHGESKIDKKNILIKDTPKYKKIHILSSFCQDKKNTEDTKQPLK